MGLDAIVRNAIRIGKQAAGDLIVTVQHEPWIGADMYKQPSYAAAEDRAAIVDVRREQIAGGGDTETVQNIVVTFLDPFVAQGADGRREPVDPRDRITLPDGTVAPIVEIRGSALDPTTNLPFMVEVVLGRKK